MRLFWKVFHYPDTRCPRCFEHEAGFVPRELRRARDKWLLWRTPGYVRVIESVTEGHRRFLAVATGKPIPAAIDQWEEEHRRAYEMTGYKLYLERALYHAEARERQ